LRSIVRAAPGGPLFDGVSNLGHAYRIHMFRAIMTSYNSYRIEIDDSQLIAESTEYGVRFGDDDQPVPIVDRDRLRSYVGLLPDGVDTPIYVEHGEEPNEYVVYVRGEAIPVRLMTARDDRLQTLRKSAAGSGSTSQTIAAPMPGMLKEILVVEGQLVHKGETLCILEAMKMENEIKAPARSRVSRLIAAAGMAVEKGAPLLELGAED
jgi:biotin carboxyl carrier protein